jgi:hypothetical protein
MGATGSRPEPTSFVALWNELPGETRERIAALADKDSNVLLKPNPAAPSPAKLPVCFVGASGTSVGRRRAALPGPRAPRTCVLHPDVSTISPRTRLPCPMYQLGTSSALDHSAATAALATVPRLQRKHYELIPKVMDEMAFWTAFFSHVTAIVAETAPQLLPAPGEGAMGLRGTSGGRRRRG